MAIDDSRVIQDFIGLIVGPAADIDLVAKANSGTQALAQLRAIRVDVVTLDLGLPDVDGIDLLDLLMARHHAGVIVLSGRVNADIERRYPQVASFEKQRLFDERERYLAAIRNASSQLPPPSRDIPERSILGSAAGRSGHHGQQEAVPFLDPYGLHRGRGQTRVDGDQVE